MPDIAEIFADHIETIAQTAATVQEGIVAASELIVHSLLSDNKVLIYGNGVANALAQVFATHLIHRFRQERPGLPAIVPNADSVMLNAIGEELPMQEVAAKQIRALGQPGDVLVLLSMPAFSDSQLRAIQAARDRDIAIILIGDLDDRDTSSLLTREDIELTIPTAVPARLLECELVVIHCLCETIDHYLFGEEVDQ